MNTTIPAEERTNFIGRVQEQRQFRVVLTGFLDHFHRWRQQRELQGADFDPAQAPVDMSYTRIFLLHGIGGIGKSWLTRRCLALADAAGSEPPVLTLYNDLSLGAPVIEPVDLLDRLYEQMVELGYEAAGAAYHQAQAELPRLAGRVASYREQDRFTWQSLVQTAVKRVAEERLTSLPPDSPPVLAKANEFLLEHMQQTGRLAPEGRLLLQEPDSVLAARLVAGIKEVALQQPVIIALDNLEIVVSLEPFIRDQLVLPTIQLPILWILSGRHNLADERVVEIEGREQVHKGYRDLLGNNPPVVWDMSTFGDADLREYLEAETERRDSALTIDNKLVAAVKSTSSGVPLVVEMVTDALFTLDRHEFLQNFVLDDKTLLPTGRLEQITARFLRYCLTREDDLMRVQGLALLRRTADQEAIRAVWALPPEQDVAQILHTMHVRYAFVQTDGLHDAVYAFVRRQLHTLPAETPADTQDNIRIRLGRRAAAHYQSQWQALYDTPLDPALRLAKPAWQESTRDLLNGLLWADPEEAIQFFLPRFVEGLGFNRPFADELLLQVEDFLAEETRLALSPFYDDLLPRLRTGLKDTGWLFDEPGQPFGRMVEGLLSRPGWEPLHLCLLHLWSGLARVSRQQYEEALAAYLTAEKSLPAAAINLREQLGQAFYRLSGRLLWPEGSAEAVPSEAARQSSRRAVDLIPESGSAWYHLAVALEYLGREADAVPAYRRAVELDPKATHYNGLGDVYAGLSDYDRAAEAYRQAIELDPAYAWPYHGLGLIHSEQGQYEQAITFYHQAIERHHRPQDEAVSWDNLGDVFTVLARYDEALAAYRQVIDYTPAEALPWYSLGNVYSALGRYNEAIEAYRRAIELEPGYAWSYHNLGLIYEARGDYAPTMVLYQQAIDRHQVEAAQAISWNSLGDVYSALNRAEEAIDAYRQAIDLDPDYALPWNNLGQAYSRLNRYQEAVEAYRQVVELTPEDSLPWYSLGNACTALQEYEQAVTAYRQAIELKPEDAWPYNNLGFVYQKLGRYEQAIHYYRQAIEYHQDDHNRAVSLDNIGNVYRTLADYQEAMTAYRRATRLSAAYAWPYHHLGELHLALDDHDTALSFFEQAIEHHERDQDRAISWHKLGDTYHIRGQLEEAITAYQRVIELHPQYALSWYSLGNIYREQENSPVNQIIEAYQRAIELDPDYAWPYHNLALICEQQADYETAEMLFQQAIERHKNNRERALSWTKLGDVHRQQQREGEAEEDYQQAITLNPAYAWPYQHLARLYRERGPEDRAAYESAVTFYRRAIERHRDTPDRARAWNSLGDTYQALARYRDAIGAYRQAIELAPDYALPWNSVGDVCRILERPEAAVDAYRRAIDLDPSEARPYHSLALVYTEQGRQDRTAHEAAIPLYRQAIERYDDDQSRARAWNDLGRTYQALHRFEDAIETYQQAIELDDQYTVPWRNLGDVYRTLSYPEDAIDAYRKAINLEPAEATAWDSLGDVYRDMERFEEAVEAYRQAIQLDPDYAWPYFSLGLIYQQQNQSTAAISSLQQAVQRYERAEDKAVAWRHLGDVYRVLNQDEEAIEAYQQALELDPDYAWPYHNLGLIHQEQENYETAVSFFRQAVERHRNDRDRVLSRHSLGDVCHTLNRYGEAIDAYQRVLELDPEDAVSWNSLGTAHTALEHYEAAIRAFERARELEPAYAWAAHNLGYVYEKREMYKEAIPHYRQAIEQHETDLDSATSWNNLGNVHFALAHYDEAIEAYQQAVRLNPAYAMPWDSLGDVYRTLDRYEEATEAYQRAIDLDPTYAWPYHNLGLVYVSQGQADSALPLYRQAIERHQSPSDQAISWTNLGSAYNNLNRYKEGIEAFHRAIECDPLYAWAYNNLGVVYARRNRYEEAIKVYHQAIQRHEVDQDKAVTWDNLGNVLATLGRYDEAIEAYQQAVTLDPGYILPRNSLGNVYRGLGRHTEALEAYQQALELNEAYSPAWNGLGDLYRALNRQNEAIEAYRRVIELDPGYAWPYHSLGIIYEGRQEYEAALTYYQQALERHRDDRPKAVVWYNIGNVYRALNRSNQNPRRTQEAVKAYRQAIALNAEYAAPWHSLGNLYSQLKRSEAAIEAYRQAMALDPGDAWSYHNLGRVYERLGERAQAVKLYQQAIERHQTDPDRALSWHHLGGVYQAWGRYDQAVSAYRQAIDLDPSAASPWNSLAGAYQELGNRQRAIRSYRRAIELDPDYAEPYNNLGFVYEQAGQYEQAISLYRQVLERHAADKEQAVSWNNLGNVYRSLTRYEEAIDAYRQAISLDPNFAWPYHNLGSIYEDRGDYEEALVFYQQAKKPHREEVER